DSNQIERSRSFCAPGFEFVKPGEAKRPIQIHVVFGGETRHAIEGGRQRIARRLPERLEPERDAIAATGSFDNKIEAAAMPRRTDPHPPRVARYAPDPYRRTCDRSGHKAIDIRATL